MNEKIQALFTFANRKDSGLTAWMKLCYSYACGFAQLC